MAKLISKTYGDALLELAVEEDKVDMISAEIESLIVILNENPDFSALMVHPRISAEEKIRIVKEVFDGRIFDELTGLLVLIVSKGRYAQINDILHYFLGCVKELKGIGVAYVTTPMELNEDRKKDIEHKLLETTDYRKMEMHYEMDDSLIGGMTIRMKDRVIDSSIRTKILKMQRDLMKIQL